MTKNKINFHKHQRNWFWHWCWNGLNDDTILKQINFITGTQDYPSELTSRTGGTQDVPSTLTSKTVDTNKSSNVTPDKVNRNNLVTYSTLQKYLIHEKRITKPHGSTTNYTGSDNSHTELSHDEENIENYKFLDKLSNKDKEDAGHPK